MQWMLHVTYIFRLIDLVKKFGVAQSALVKKFGAAQYLANECCKRHLGDTCPVCLIPGHVKDAQVNRQLYNLVALTQRLEKVLLGETDDDDEEIKPCERNSIESNEAPPLQPLPSNRGQRLRNRGSVYDFESPSHSPVQSPLHRQPRSRKRPVKKAVQGSNGSVQQNSISNYNKRVSPKSAKIMAANQTTMSQYFDYMEDEEEAGYQIEAPETENEAVENENEASKNSSRMDKVTNGNRGGITEQNEVKITDFESDSNVDGQTSSASKRMSNSHQKNSKKKNPNKQLKQKGKNLRLRELSKSLNEGDSSDCHITEEESDSSRGNMKDGSRKIAKSKRRHSVDMVSFLGVRLNTDPKSSKDVDPIALLETGDSLLLESNQKKSNKNLNRRSLNSSLTLGGKKSTVNTVDKKNAKGETPLQVACIKGDTERVCDLLEQGANPNSKDYAGWTPLHEACHHGHVRIAEMLLEKGALIDVPGTDNDTPLHDAICQGKTACVTLLVSWGASLSIRNAKGWTPADLALSEDMVQAIETPVIHQANHTPMEVDVPLQQSLCFLSTGLSREQKGVLQKCAGLLRAQIVDEFTPLVSHVITSVNKDGVCPRTIKYLQSVLTGKWIVSMEWIAMCLEYEDRVCEDAFEVPGASSTPESLAPQKGRLNSQKQLPGLFDGCQFYFQGTFEYPTPRREDLVGLVKLGGGKVLTREPKPGHISESDLSTPYHSQLGRVSCCIYIVHDNGSPFAPIKTPVISTITPSWIMDCIANFQLLPC
ncbi:hypothetical protein FSP39_021013 [Pinctada imbricata]|uniref:BRCT domain-containing protein n=1 Tax=Pinctada imbricata TaxID=66713 RepID=A0AA88YXN8_PINIB|nr:hypothetical protein FSP39_021013 [Pinctada imbricata]